MTDDPKTTEAPQPRGPLFVSLERGALVDRVRDRLVRAGLRLTEVELSDHEGIGVYIGAAGDRPNGMAQVQLLADDHLTFRLYADVDPTKPDAIPRAFAHLAAGFRALEILVPVIGKCWPDFACPECQHESEVREAVTPLARAIDEERWNDARRLLSELGERFDPNEPELIRLGSMMSFMGAGDDRDDPPGKLIESWPWNTPGDTAWDRFLEFERVGIRAYSWPEGQRTNVTERAAIAGKVVELREVSLAGAGGQTERRVYIREPAPNPLDVRADKLCAIADEIWGERPDVNVDTIPTAEWTLQIRLLKDGAVALARKVADHLAVLRITSGDVTDRSAEFSATLAEIAALGGGGPLVDELRRLPALRSECFRRVARLLQLQRCHPWDEAVSKELKALEMIESSLPTQFRLLFSEPATARAVAQTKTTRHPDDIALEQRHEDMIRRLNEVANEIAGPVADEWNEADLVDYIVGQLRVNAAQDGPRSKLLLAYEERERLRVEQIEATKTLLGEPGDDLAEPVMSLAARTMTRLREARARQGFPSGLWLLGDVVNYLLGHENTRGKDLENALARLPERDREDARQRLEGLLAAVDGYRTESRRAEALERQLARAEGNGSTLVRGGDALIRAVVDLIKAPTAERDDFMNNVVGRLKLDERDSARQHLDRLLASLDALSAEAATARTLAKRAGASKVDADEIWNTVTAIIGEREDRVEKLMGLCRDREEEISNLTARIALLQQDFASLRRALHCPPDKADLIEHARKVYGDSRDVEVVHERLCEVKVLLGLDRGVYYGEVAKRIEAWKREIAELTMFRTHLIQLLGAIGVGVDVDHPGALARAEQLVGFERELAQVQRERDNLKNALERCRLAHPSTVAQICRDVGVAVEP